MSGRLATQSPLDATSWRESKKDNRSFRTPKNNHKGVWKSRLWQLNFCNKPVEAQLTVLDKKVRGPAQPGCDLTRHRYAGAPTLPESQGSGIIQLCEDGQLGRAVDVLTALAETQSRLSTTLLYRVIQRCAVERNLVLGRRLDDLTVKLGHGSNAFLASHILRMYACQGRFQEAMEVFARVVKPSVYTWFYIISELAKHGNPRQAIQLYHDMCRSGQEPNCHIFAAVLQACARAEDLQSGMQVYHDVLKSGIQPDSFVCTCLINMYAQCGKLEDASRVFEGLASKSVVTWTAMINGYAEHGLGHEALALYAKMEQEGLTLADGFTFSCLLKACASAGALSQGRQLHSRIQQTGLLRSNKVVGTSLMNMYAKCGELEEARKVFDSLATRNVVTWTAMISGYAEHGLGHEALTLYARMEQEGLILPDSVTFSCLLRACASAGSLQLGKQLHSQILERRLLEGDSVMATCLVNMYANCGKLEDARTVFDGLATKNAVTWTAMINGYGANNEGNKAIACFEDMILAGVHPNATTFTCLLAACSHEGLVSNGRQYFDAMVSQHGLHPSVEHYMCMVDLLGRAGHTDEAGRMLLSAGCENNEVGLMSLLNACKIHGDIELGTWCFQSLVKLAPQDASAYVLMANMYADADRWEDVDRVERLRKLAGATKKPAMAGIEVKQQVHTFVVGQKRDDILSKVRSTSMRLKEEGNYIPHTQLVLKPLSEKEKEEDLCGHAEKLALAYGLLNTPEGTPLLVTKNLRMCKDCHTSTEIMSRVERRDIVVRDAYCVHRFEAGSCSCNCRN